MAHRAEPQPRLLHSAHEPRGRERHPAIAGHDDVVVHGQVEQPARGHELLLGRRRRERDGATWSLPKGTPDGDETTEQTALREVREETGLETPIADTVGDMRNRFVGDVRRVGETVH